MFISNPENTSEQGAMAFVEQLIKANGERIPLRNFDSVMNEELSVSAIWDSNDSEEVLLIDLYTSFVKYFGQSEPTVTPIGFRDYIIKDGNADTSREAHSLLNITDKYHTISTLPGSQIGTSLLPTTYLDVSRLAPQGLLKQPIDSRTACQPLYMSKHLGSFMNALGILCLKSKGIKTITKGLIIEQKMDEIYTKMGFPVQDNKALISTLTQNGYCYKSVARYI